MMKFRHIALSGLLFVLPFIGKAQYQIGFMNSNYGGINSIISNPANGADNRMRFQLNLGSAGLNFSNNYLETQTPYSYFNLMRAYLKDPNIDSLNGAPVWDDSYLKERINGKDKFVNFSTEIRGPGFMWSWDDKNAVGLFTRVRFAAQINDLSEPLARLSRYSLDYTSLNNVFHADNKFGINVNMFSELGLNYSRVLMDEGAHFLKVGGSVKMLRGLYSMYIQNKGININFVTSDSLVMTQDVVRYGYVREQFYGVNSSNSISAGIRDAFKGALGGGLGLDLGVVYEYRPDYDEYRVNMDCQDRWMREKVKYKYRISASLLDMGAVKYNNDTYVNNYGLRLLSNSDTVRWGQLDTMNISSTSQFSKYVSGIVRHTDSSHSYKSGLPTTINIAFDYRFNKFFYISGNWTQNLRKFTNIGMRTTSMLAVQPRVEFRHFEFGLPLLAAFDYTKFQIGAYMRMGPVYIGSDNIGGFFGKTTFNGLDLYAGVTIPIYKHAFKDKDGDGVSNKKDHCKSEKGTCETNGCPDTDKDGLTDDKDKCPTVAGKKEFYGCPDSDGDGIVDSEDKCPDAAGTKELNGCPDTDNDGIIDSEDKCPTVAGKKELNGCPDTDNDGIIDSEDKCPTVAGKKELKGCPDSDNDGVADADDKCPTVAGKKELAGCPDRDNDGVADADDRCPDVPGLAAFKGCKDTDLDGIADPDDKCPTQYGTKENNGCPLVKQKETFETAQVGSDEQQLLKLAFENLTFETGKSTVSETSKPGLDSLAAMLKKNPTVGLYITGHTDNEGSKAKNLQLSADRANAVKAYLISKGVPAAQLVAKGLGDTVPVAPNTTAENKRKNRRVELKLIKVTK